MNRIRYYIRTLLLMLLLIGAANEAWADKTVTYHVITLPFGSAELTGGDDAAHKYRIEAIKKTVTCADDATLDLPAELKSPLLTNDAYTYYYTGNGGVTINADVKIFPQSNNSIKYNTYTIDPSKAVTSLEDIGSAGDPIDIYVTYDWAGHKSEYGNWYKLDGSELYNIEFVYKDKGTEKHEFFAMNMNEPRGNRAQAIPFEDIKSPSDLCIDGPHTLKDGKSDEGQTAFHYTWLLLNDDPYNIILETAYAKDDGDWGSFIYKENSIPKKSKRARFYGRVNSNTAVESNSWMNNEWGYGWFNGSGDTPVRTDMPGWFRGTNRTGINTNGVQDKGLYFSFALLKRTAADNDLTLVALCANTNASTWVPNGSGHYLHLGRKTGKYPGPYYSSFADADKVILHDIRTYHFKVKTPFYNDALGPEEGDNPNHVLSYDILLSEHYEPYNILDFVPDALKRKYVTFKGAYKEAGLTNALTTFADVEEADNGRVIWLKYSTTMPFMTGDASTAFNKLKWYNLVADKNTNYTVWYDTSGEPARNYFSTHTGHSKYGHESHFAFIGDPFELYVINREVSQTDSNTPHYLQLAPTASDPLTTGTSMAVGNMWEIVYDDDKSDFKDCFRLRKFGTYGDPHPLYLGWNKTGSFPLNGSEDALRLYIEDLPLMTYTYYIVNLTGEVAVKASAEQMTGIALSYETIPDVIKTPFLDGATLTFYNFNSKADFEAKTLANKTQIHTTNSDQGDANEYKNHILVYYSGLQSTYTDLINGTDAAAYNVILNNEYIYYEASTIKSNTSIVGISTDAQNLWKLGGSDPYRMTIKNEGANQYVSVPNWAAGALDWSSAVSASKFIIKAGPSPGTYEVMAATGWDVDADTTYYNIGRPAANMVKMVSNAEYAHGYQQIMFQLKKSSAKQIKYHLIDRSNTLLLSENARQAREEQPQIPAEYFCPLVEKYTYWMSDPRDPSPVVYGDEEAFKDKYDESAWASADTIEVWITYTTSDEVDLKHTTMYLLKYLQGDEFYQEDGADGMTSTKIQAVYPYCNGDCNLNIYGQAMYEQQQEGAASTRTRWAWYLESSGDNDPYHVRILSRQTETYNGLDRSAYFATRKFEGYDEVVTTLVWPNISGVQSTDYMILGTDHQYQLVTTEEIDGKRYVVDSFEQYWKTYDTVKKKLLEDLLPLCEEKERTDRVDGSIEVPLVPQSLRDRLTGDDTGEYGFHSYQKMAYAKRWNGYNAAGEKKKGWETKEHWFQTVKMGSGYFDLIPTVIDPALILLDQHGWEIMRKPLPSSPDDPEKEKKYDVLRQYDSPMVKEYIFWSSAKKRSGYHQYYLLDKRIGGDFTSTSLTELPPFDSENVHDAKGNHNDEYVTYIVKEEYAKSYVPGTTPTAYPFLIRQGNSLAKKGEEGNKIAVDGTSGVSQYIIEHINSLSDELWYVRPNTDIDREMGYPATHPDWKDNPNAYEDATYRTYQVADFIEGASDDAMVKAYGRFTFSNGFDPYNIQICSQTGAKYFTTGMTGAEIDGGSIKGQYGSQAITLADKNSTPVSGDSYDGKKFNMTNQTFMAVRGNNGEIQLMPRFDHQLRMQDFATLVTPESSAEDEHKLEKTYTQLYRPYVYNYLIVDNTGHESLRYMSGGDLLPQTPAHLKSPLATDFKYYSGLTATAGVYQLTNLDSKEIKASLAGAGLTTPSVTNSNHVYVRYAYNEQADSLFILKGNWLTMQLNAKNAIYNSGIKQSGESKPAPVAGTTHRQWQWKFLKHPYSDPDPYAVQMFNRLNANQDKPMSVLTESMDGRAVSAQTDGADGYHQHFALLSHSDLNGDGKADTYALAVARTGAYTYPFLNGYGMTTSDAAIIKEDKSDYVDPLKTSGFNSTSGNFHATGTRVQLFNDVTNDYTYKVYTNAHTEAITATQTHDEVITLDNGFAPTLPEEVRSPMLNIDQYRYYEAVGDLDVESKELETLYGLYDNEVYVRYTYDPTTTEYKVPNERNTPGADGHVRRGENSNDTPLKFGAKMLYNFVWYNDNMMKGNEGGTGVESAENHVLEYGDKKFEWQLFGDDPYAIQIKNRGADKYIDASNGLSATPQTFMLLSKADYDYGVLAKTGDKEAMLSLSLDGSTLTTTADPNKFVIFALSTLKVVYHLTISNIGSHAIIPYRKGARATKDDPDTYKWNEKERGYTEGWDAGKDTLHVMGTTKRDLTTAVSGVAGDKYQLGATVSYPNLAGTLGSTTYCKDFGPISLGDALTVPTEFYRPNVVYSFVIQDIQNGGVSNNALNNKYKGMEIKSREMGLDEDLIGKTLYINIVYGFDDDLESNSGDNFVLSLNENKWYTLETQVGEDTYLAQYTNAWGFEMKEGRGSHYTNDFLWSPIGDPYGFQLFNRYMDVNSGDDNLGEKNRVIFSRHFFNDQATDEVGGDTDIHDGGQQILMGQYVAPNAKLVVVGKAGGPIASYPYTKVEENSIYELLAPTDPEDESLLGYFRFHPVANTKDQPQVYFNPVWADDDGDDAVNHANNFLVRLSPTAANFTFGLSKDLIKPYFDRAGYVGGLKKEVYNAHPDLVAAMKDDAEPTATQLRDAQVLVYNYKENIVPFKTGYYRLHSPLGISDINPTRYVSGYTHAIERDQNGDTYETDAIPMHFYEENSERVRTFTDLKTGFKESHATRGDLQILPVERDPASIFHFKAIYNEPDKPVINESPNPDYRNNLSYISTQGLYVRGKVAKGASEAGHSDFDGSQPRAAAVMTKHALPTDSINPAEDEPTPLFVMDLGGGILLIHDNKTEGGRANLKYFCYDHEYDMEGKPTVYDMKMTHNTHTDHAKFCMQPVQNTTTKGVNEMPLKLNLNKGGDGYYYATFCAPYDVLLTDATNDAAYICLVWDTEMLHLKKVGKYNAAPYKDNNQFVPAGTPVIIRSTKTSVTMALPTTTPTASLTQGIFEGTYLEQLLAEETSMATSDVYTFGLPLKGTVTKHVNYASPGSPNNGELTISLPQTEESGVGFYINANPNREGGGAMGLWIPNNRYVYNNKIYYRLGGGGSAPRRNQSGDFIPVAFDDEDEEEPEGQEPDMQMPHDNCVYDLLGRRVASGKEVRDGTWKHHVHAGIYVLNGKKVMIQKR